MKEWNNSQREAESIQYRFTSYLVTAIRRRREEYIQRKNKQSQLEFVVDEKIGFPESGIEPDMLSELPLLMQLECNNLIYALKQISEKERYVFFFTCIR